jgi:hypothetical protein
MLCEKYSSPDIIRRVKEGGMGKACNTHGEKNAYSILAGKQEGKRPPGRPIHSWKVNIKVDLREIHEVLGKTKRLFLDTTRNA